MSSYHGENTAKMQEQLRRDTKRKQSRGAGARSHAEQKIDLKEVAKFVPRHLEAEFTPDTLKALFIWQNNSAHFTPIGAKALYELIMRGLITKDNTTDPATNTTHKIIATLVGRDASLVGCDGRQVMLTDKGFASADGKELPLDIWSITVRCNVVGSDEHTPVYGLKVEYLYNRASGARDTLTVY